jgi:putative endonuclease
LDSASPPEGTTDRAGERARYVYAVRCADGSLYIGYTTDPERRLRQHNAGKASRYTRARLPVALVGLWTFATVGEALRFEHALKGLPRPRKEAAVAAAQTTAVGDPVAPALPV